MSRNSSLFWIAVIAPVLVPFVSNAEFGTIRTFIERLIELITLTLPIIGALTLLFVLWNGVKTIAVSGDAKGREEMRSALVWGVLILFVMMSVWGIVAILRNTFF